MRLKLDPHDCWSRDIATALCLVMTLVLFKNWSIIMSSQDITLLLCPVLFFLITQHVITHISSRVAFIVLCLYCINELSETSLTAMGNKLMLKVLLFFSKNFQERLLWLLEATTRMCSEKKKKNCKPTCRKTF